MREWELQSPTGSPMAAQTTTAASGTRDEGPASPPLARTPRGAYGGTLVPAPGVFVGDTPARSPVVAGHRHQSEAGQSDGPSDQPRRGECVVQPSGRCSLVVEPA